MMFSFFLSFFSSSDTTGDQLKYPKINKIKRNENEEIVSISPAIREEPVKGKMMSSMVSKARIATLSFVCLLIIYAQE